MFWYLDIVLSILPVVLLVSFVVLAAVELFGGKPVTVKKKKIYEYLQYDLHPDQISETIYSQKIKDDIEIRINYEHDKVVYCKYRRVQIIINIFMYITLIFFCLIPATVLSSCIAIISAFFVDDDNIEWIAITLYASAVAFTVSLVIMVIAIGIALAAECCLRRKFFKPYTGKGYGQFIGIKEDKLPKKFESKYKSLEDLCDIDTYRDCVINLGMAEFLDNNDICSFDLICSSGISKNDLPFNKIKFYGLSKQGIHHKFIISKTFDLKTLLVNNNEPMRLYYDFDKRVICLKIPRTYITGYKVKDLHIELSRLSKEV